MEGILLQTASVAISEIAPFSRPSSSHMLHIILALLTRWASTSINAIGASSPWRKLSCKSPSMFVCAWGGAWGDAHDGACGISQGLSRAGRGLLQAFILQARPGLKGVFACVGLPCNAQPGRGVMCNPASRGLAAAHVAQQDVHPRTERGAVARAGGAALQHADQAVRLLLSF